MNDYQLFHTLKNMFNGVSYVDWHLYKQYLKIVFDSRRDAENVIRRHTARNPWRWPFDNEALEFKFRIQDPKKDIRNKGARDELMIINFPSFGIQEESLKEKLLNKFPKLGSFQNIIIDRKSKRIYLKFQSGSDAMDGFMNGRYMNLNGKDIAVLFARRCE